MAYENPKFLSDFDFLNDTCLFEVNLSVEPCCMNFKGQTMLKHCLQGSCISLIRRSWRPTMSETKLLSYPLTGHIDKPMKTKAWDLPKLSVALPIMPTTNKFMAMGKITCVVGGFVGSKSQRNQDKDAIFHLDTLIQQEMAALVGLQGWKKEKYFSSQGNCLKAMSSICFRDDDSETDDSSSSTNSSAVKELMAHASVCLANLGQQSRCRRLSSECSVDSNDSDFVVFADNDEELNQETADNEDLESDDDDYDEDETVIFEEGFEDQKKVRFNPAIEVHVMRVWDYASRAARISPWPQVGRDRVRFTERISKSEQILAPILSQAHREEIRAKLFENR